MSVLGSSKVMTFIAAKDAAASRDFYENVLGLNVVSEDDWAIVFDLGGTMLRMQKNVDFTPQQFTVLGWHVDDIAAAMADLRSKGVKFEQYPWMPADSDGVMTFPGDAKVAWFLDPSGNNLSLTQF
jgi:catechol 2,3-dioxygenase-like lactoylglutathione lyase family enzyme